MRTRPIWLFGVGMLWAVGCQLIGGMDDLRFGEGTGASAGSTTATGVAAGGDGGLGGESCHPVGPPQPPDAGSGGEAPVDIVLALRSVDLGEEGIEASGPTFGFDLDGLCTCSDTEDRGCELPPTVAQGAPQCDGPDGIDNNFAKLMAAALTFIGDTSASWSESAERGTWSLLIRITEYNGLPDDAQVRVAMHSTRHFDDDPCHANADPPAWDGSDQWPVPRTTFMDAPVGGSGGAGGAGGGPTCGGVPDATQLTPSYVDDVGYVTNGVLVARWPKGAFVVEGETLRWPVTLTAGVLSGELVQEQDLWQLKHATLAGHWLLEDVFDAIGQFQFAVPLCTDNQFYVGFKDALCSSVDVSTELVGPRRPCNALSYGFAFEASQAQFGSVVEPVELVSQCPAETNPANDSCND